MFDVVFQSPGRLVIASIVAVAVVMATSAVFTSGAKAEADPAAWGSNHVGQEMPLYEDGNTCLFCHRHHVGPYYQAQNQHQITIRLAEDDADAVAALDGAVDDVGYLLGVGEYIRFLKRGAGYGKMDLLEGALYHHPAGDAEPEMHISGEPTWNDTIFGSSCAGCHTSGVDSAAQTFTAFSMDCHTCHGLVPSGHTEDGSMALLSKNGEDDPRVVMSICGSCHLRGGKSESTGFPFPDNFVPGDNLFIDFKVDLSAEFIASIEDLGERHIYENTREVMVLGNTETTCVTCHQIHGASTQKHERVRRSEGCFTCHFEEGAAANTRPYNRHSAVCQY